MSVSSSAESWNYISKAVLRVLAWKTPFRLHQRGPDKADALTPLTVASGADTGRTITPGPG